MRLSAYLRRRPDHPALGGFLAVMARVTTYLAGIAVLGALSVHAFQSVAGALARHSLEIASGTKPVVARASVTGLEVSHRVLQEDWYRSVSPSRRNSTFSAPSPPGRIDRNQRSNLTRPPEAPPFTLFGDWGNNRREWGEPLPVGPLQQYRTYRTVCVRLCDGFYFPISFTATQDRFARDEAQCVSSCGSEAKLYIYRNPGENPDQMVDLRGQPYARLKTAFLYRTSYNESCKCRPHAWEQVSLDRHRLYALETMRRKGDRTVQTEIEQIRERQRQTVLEQRTIRKQSEIRPTRNGQRVLAATTSGRPTASDVSATYAAGAAPGPDPAPAPAPRGGEFRPDVASNAQGLSTPGEIADMQPPRNAKKKQRAKSVVQSQEPGRPQSSGGLTWRNVFER